MFINKFNRHIIAFLITALASTLLYPVAQAGLVTITWLLLGLILLAAVFTLMTK